MLYHVPDVPRFCITFLGACAIFAFVGLGKNTKKDTFPLYRVEIDGMECTTYKVVGVGSAASRDEQLAPLLEVTQRREGRISNIALVEVPSNDRHWLFLETMHAW